MSEPDPPKRRSTDPLINLIEEVKTHAARLADGDEAIQQIKADLATNTAATTRIEADTRDIVLFFESMKGAFRVLNWIGKLASPMGKIIGFFTAAYVAWQLVKPAWCRW